MRGGSTEIFLHLTGGSADIFLLDGEGGGSTDIFHCCSRPICTSPPTSSVVGGSEFVVGGFSLSCTPSGYGPANR